MRKNKRDAEGVIAPVINEPSQWTAKPTREQTTEAEKMVKLFGDPMQWLVEQEATAIEVLRELEEIGSAIRWEFHGVSGVHKFKFDYEAWESTPAIIHDAAAILGATAGIASEINAPILGTPRVGYLVILAAEIGERMAAMKSRRLEPYAKFGIDRERDFDSKRKATPVTKEAKRLLKNGISQKKLAEAMGVTPKIARRWHEDYHRNKK